MTESPKVKERNVLATPQIFKVKIVRCGQPTYWYANQIGNVFEVSIGKEAQYELDFIVMNPSGRETDFLIDKSDCAPVGKSDCAPERGDLTFPPKMSYYDIHSKKVTKQKNLIENLTTQYKHVRNYSDKGRTKISNAGGLTICSIYSHILDDIFIGVAECDLQDNFNKGTGRKLSFERAMAAYARAKQHHTN